MQRGFSSAVILCTGLTAFSLYPAVALPADSYVRLPTPNSGSARERVRQLWVTTRPIVLADAKAGLSDAEYVKRRARVFDSWIGLQIGISADHLEGPGTVEAKKLTVEILSLIDRVYGIPFYNEKKRADIRARTVDKIEQRLAAVDRKVAGLFK